MDDKQKKVIVNGKTLAPCVKGKLDRVLTQVEIDKMLLAGRGAGAALAAKERDNGSKKTA